MQQSLLSVSCSIGRRRPHVNDVSWRLQYHMKVIRTSFGVFLFHNMSGKQRIKMCFFCQNSQVDKVNEPFYLISLNTEVTIKHSRTFLPSLSWIFLNVRCVSVRETMTAFVPFVRMKDPRRISTLLAQWSSYR